ncbi:MAG: nuclear transport factor 2 family protein [Cyclobacteriaceae bacterium]
MNSNEQLIHQFYTAFQQLDAASMQACYHDDIRFSDPAFPQLKGKEAGAMWAMLTEALKKNPADWKLEFSNSKADVNTGSCRWEAHYTFSLTGRKVHNIIQAKFRFKEGKIVEHTDMFDFYRWTRMAFGITGLLLGWTPYFRNKLQTTTRKRLDAYLKGN